MSFRTGKIIHRLAAGEARNKRALASLREARATGDRLSHEVAQAGIRLAHSEWLMGKLFEKSPIAILVAEPDGSIVLVGGIACGWGIQRGDSLWCLDGWLCRLVDLMVADAGPRQQSIETRSKNRCFRWSAEWIDFEDRQVLSLSGIDITQENQLLELQHAFVQSANHRMRNPLARAKAALELLPRANPLQTQSLVSGGLSGIAQLTEILDRITVLDHQPITNETVLIEYLIKSFQQQLESRLDGWLVNHTSAVMDQQPVVGVGMAKTAITTVAEELVANIAQHGDRLEPVRVRWRLVGAASGRFIVGTLTNYRAHHAKLGDNLSYYGLRMGLNAVRRLADEAGGAFVFREQGAVAAARLTIPIKATDING